MRSARLRLGLAAMLLVGVGVACGSGSNGSDDSTDLDGSTAGDGSFSNDASSSGDGAQSGDGSQNGDGSQGDDGSAKDGGGSDVTDAAPDAPSLNGTLTVHSQYPGYAIVGDGSKLAAPVTGNAQSGYSVTFNDASLVGAQNVTFVLSPTISGSLNAVTYVGVATPDVRFGAALPAPTSKLGSVSGTVQAYDASFRLGGVQTPHGYYSSPAYAVTDVAGHFTIPVYGPAGGPFDLVVGAVQNPGSITVAAGGMKMTLPTDAGDAAAILVDAGTNLVLDHPYDQMLTVNLADSGADGGPYGTKVGGVNIDFLEGNAASGALGNSYGSITSAPFSIPAFQLTAPFDDWQRTITFYMTAGPYFTRIYQSFPAGVTNATVTLPQPPTITMPALNPDGGVTTVSHTGLTFGWHADSASELSGGSWNCTGADGGGTLSWFIIGAGSSGTFTFFTLPADAGTDFLAIPPSTCQAYVEGTILGGGTAQDVFHEGVQQMNQRLDSVGGIDTTAQGYKFTLQ